MTSPELNTLIEAGQAMQDARRRIQETFAKIEEMAQWLDDQRLQALYRDLQAAQGEFKRASSRFDELATPTGLKPTEGLPAVDPIQHTLEALR